MTRTALTSPLDYRVSGTASNPRAHRATCRRLNPSAPNPNLYGTPGTTPPAPASCCKPSGPDLAAAWAQVRDVRSGRAEQDVPVDLADGYVAATDRNLVAEKRERLDRGARSTGRKTGHPAADRQPTASARRALLDTLSAVVPGYTPPREDAPTGRVTVPPALHAAVHPEGPTQACAGVCGQTLPLRRFPTTGPVRPDGTQPRGTECRACRDARRGSGAPAPSRVRAAAGA